MIALAFAAPIAVGFLVLRAGWPESARPAPPALLIGLGGCLGLGFCSCGYFFAHAVAGRPGDGYVFLDLVLLALTGFAAVRAAPKSRPERPLEPTGRLVLWLKVCFAVVAVAVVLDGYVHYDAEPHGDRDAVGIWNVRARFLVRTPEGWGNTFSPLLWHADYPLLVPCGIARCWTYTGEEPTLVPALSSWVMFALTALIVVGGVTALRGRVQGWLAGTVLICATPFVAANGLQYADTPLAATILGTAVVCAFHDAGERRSRFLPVLAGALAGSAAWTKNEGLLFLVLVVVVRVGTAVRAGNRVVFYRDALAFAVGLAVPLLALVVFKTEFAPPSDLIAGQQGSALSKLTDPERHLAIVEAFGNLICVTNLRTERDLFDWGPGLAVGLPLYALLLGRCPRSARVPGASSPLLLLGLMAAGYYAVYLLTPHDLKWHLETSLSRLLVQLWPLTVFATFLFIATPRERAP